jgi:hypothetical protein
MEESDICPPWALTPPPPPPYQGAQILANVFLKLHLTMMYHCAKYEVKVHDGVGQQDSRYPLSPTLPHHQLPASGMQHSRVTNS